MFSYHSNMLSKNFVAINYAEYTLASRYPNRGGVSVSELVQIKFVLITNHLRVSRYPNSVESYKSSDTEAPWYPNRGGGLGI